jgi:uncharacterized protein YkwD
MLHMRGPRLLSSALIAALVLWLVVAPLQPTAQSPNRAAELLIRVNQLRLDEGLPPLRSFNLLDDSAQRHAQDLAANGLSSTTGSNGSTPGHRIAAAGYTAWQTDDGAPVVGENVWVGIGLIDDALAYFAGDEVSRRNLFSTAFREIGIGVAAGADGRDYYVIDFGARPNVLPIFINYGDESTVSPQVAIRLTNEEVRPGGEGSVFMGRAIEIRISDTPDWEGVAWQPWEELVAWTLAGTPGENTVYVQFRDGAGRTAAAGDSIWFGETPPTAMPPTQPAAVVETPASEPSDGAVAPAEPVATAIAPVGTRIAVEITPFPTWTPLPPDDALEEEVRPPDEPNYPFGLLLGLQGVATMLGIYAALRRKPLQVNDTRPDANGRPEASG